MRTRSAHHVAGWLEQRVADQVGEIERMRRLRRFLPPQVASLIVASGTEKQVENHRREITALFCDLRGFAGFSKSADPEDVTALLHAPMSNPFEYPYQPITGLMTTAPTWTLGYGHRLHPSTQPAGARATPLAD